MFAARDHSEPQPTAETRDFWDAARAGRLLVRRCTACGRTHWYPRTHCPFCASAAGEWIEASGRGRIYAFSVMRRADPSYIMAYVTLDEGPTMMTNLVDCDPAGLKTGDPVRVVFHTTPGGQAVPMFTPTGPTP